MKVSKNYRRMSEVYKYFCRGWPALDFSEEALLEQFKAETYANAVPHERNGFFHGKKWMDVTLAMWREDIATGLLTKHELYQDNDLPDWWLDKVLKNYLVEI